MAPFLLSVVIPVFNEERNIEPLLQRLLPVLRGYRYEIIFVNDGSSDKTLHCIKTEADKKSAIKFLSFNRNFGHQAALSAGYSFAQGDCVISMDADLQDPPEIIPQLIKEWEHGAKIVYAQRKKREGDTWFKRITAQWFYSIIVFLSDVPIPQQVGDFRLLDKEVVKFLNDLPERSQFLRGLVVWSGFQSATVQFDREARHAGRTHYNFSRMMNFALDGITSFSTKPLRIASYLGFFAAFVGFLGIVYAVIGRLFRPPFFPHDWVTGWTGLFVGIMFIGGVQLISIGIIGEYIGKIYNEVQRRPKFIIQEKGNL